MKLFRLNVNKSLDLRAVWPASRPLLGSLACAILFLILFAWLADGVFSGSHEELDLHSRRFIHQFANPSLTAAMQTVTFLGSFNLLWILFLILTISLYLLELRRPAAWFAIAMGGELLLELTLKLAFHRVRPEAFFGPGPTSYSFPSGHALGSFCFYGVLAGLFYDRIQNRAIRILVWIATACLVLAIGFSRIYLGVHYLTDVIAGYFAAAVWVSSLLFVSHVHRAAKQRRS